MNVSSIISLRICLILIISTIEKVIKDDVDIICVNDLTRKCYSIIVEFMMNYEEQILITSIKKNQQCFIYQILSQKRENLMNIWQSCIHQFTQRQIQQQKKDDISKKNSIWIHFICNFAWSHYMINIHKCMMIDILHQLLKDTVIYMLNWLNKLIEKRIVASRKKKEYQLHINHAFDVAQLNEWFHNVSAFVELKIFTKYNVIKQWITLNRKIMICQILSIIASLLTHESSAMMHCTWAMIDFIMLAQYTSYDEDILKYMQHALFQWNKLKKVFWHLWSFDTDTQQRHFNILKFHAMIYYANFIHWYDVINNVNMKYEKICYKHLIKKFFDCTNKYDTFLNQLIHYNTRHLNLLAMKNILLYEKTKFIQVKKNVMSAMITIFCRVIDLSKLSISVFHAQCYQILDARLDSKKWCLASTLMKNLNIFEFLNVLTVFIREFRNVIDEIQVFNHNLDKRVKNAVNAKSCFITIHDSFIYWKWDEKNKNDLNSLIKDRVICVLNWQKSEKWRCNCVLIQESSASSNDSSDTLNDCLSEWLQLIISVIDWFQQDDRNCFLKYINAFIDLLKSWNKNTQQKVHEMMKIEHWSKQIFKNSHFIDDRRFYNMSTILQSLHVMSTITKQKKVEQRDFFYINNFVDWDIYNIFYDKDFLTNETRAVEKFNELDK